MALLTAEALLARVTAAVETVAVREGYDSESIAAGVTFREWCNDLARKGLKVDRKPFSLEDRPALVPIYDAIPVTREQARGRILVVQKATQLGLTVWEALADVYMAKKFGPVNIGLFLPDQTTASFKSEHRFMPILRSVPDLLREMVYRADESGRARRVGEGNILTRQLGSSLIMFLWTSGKVTTESRPMDIVSLDEVQGMTLAQIDKVFARLGDSRIGFKMLLSTAFMPESDINFWYKLGTQEVWHTECEHCGELSDLSEPTGRIFPDRSTAYNTGQIEGAPVNEYVWTCPCCGGWIHDPQRGRYVVQNPSADPTIRSFLLPRTVSPRATPRELVEAFQRARTGDQKQSFYNRALARPYVDADQLPVTLEHCLACVAEGKRIGLEWERSGDDCYMGIDQMGGWNAVIIKRRLADGRQAVVWVEAIFEDDPFRRCAELMRLYGVSVCVVEQLPNVNDARRFANAHRGRVFLAGYANLRDDMMVWGDDLSKSDRRTAEEDRSRYAVALNQYKAMQTALFRVRERHCLFPDPDLLEQDVIEDGKPKRIPILRDWVFLHLTKTALVIQHDEEQRIPKAKVVKVGLDPHFSFANMLCDVAWARNHGSGMVILPEKPDPLRAAQTDRGRKIEQAMAGLPKGVVRMMEDLPAGVCGRCTAFPKAARDAGAAQGLCAERDIMVGARDACCPLFVSIDDDG